MPAVDWPRRPLARLAAARLCFRFIGLCSGRPERICRPDRRIGLSIDPTFIFLVSLPAQSAAAFAAAKLARIAVRLCLIAKADPRERRRDYAKRVDSLIVARVHAKPWRQRRVLRRVAGSIVLGRIRHLARASYHYLYPSHVVRQYLAKHDDDEVEMDFLDILAAADREAIDVGANLGRYTVPLSRLVPHVHAFEPHPRLARVLHKTMPKNVTVRQAAVSDREGMVELKIPLRSAQQVESLGSLEITEAAEAYRKIAVPAVTLDAFLSRPIGFIKIDVEGHELSAITGARRLLSEQKPIVLAEVDDNHRVNATREVFAMMTGLGYGGLFIFQNRVWPLDAFDAGVMQSPAGRHAAVPRKLQPYVNNFVFAPQAVCSSVQERLTAALSK